MTARFAILDRDGTTIVERHYLSDPNQVELVPNAAMGLRRMRQLGLGLVVITNQSAVGRGFIDRERLDLIHQRMSDLFAAEQVELSGVYFCPHTPEDNCLCRKPNLALIEQAAKDLGFNAQDSFVIGDKPCDIELGQGMGGTTFLVRTGYGAQVEAEAKVTPDYIVDDLVGAATVIERLLSEAERTMARAT